MERDDERAHPRRSPWEPRSAERALAVPWTRCSDINVWEIIAIAVLALLIFGPDKLPGLAPDAARLLREVRKMATGARQDLQGLARARSSAT